ncbi:MAG: hypothetical protein BWY09_02357 [Candidatus Hydrogenedentes bacterium ADurb.Bin179]|nr:MAG: hypothetical protein BWY09_02357 [Candidatus Hydrogenedentes bacterium ADurb.Bin179]
MAKRCLTFLKGVGIIEKVTMTGGCAKNKARLRFCVISEHKPEQIVRALDTLVEAARELNIPLPATAAR